MTLSSPAGAITHRAVVTIALPMMFAYLSTALVGAVSLAAIGRLGQADLSAGIAIGAILFDILFSSLSFLRSTTLGLTAIAMGAGRPAQARAILQRAMTVAIGLGLLILCLRGWAISLGLPLLGAAGPVQRVAAGYAAIRILSAPFALGNYAILGALLGLGRATAGLALQLILNGTNILCCVTLVLVLHRGVGGAAWAAVCGEAAAFLAGVIWLARSGGARRGAGLAAALTDGPGWRQMAVLNRDTLIRSLALLFVFAFFTRQGAGFGAAVLAANAIHLQFFALSANCLDGFAAAAEQMAGRMIGARHAVGFRRAVRLTFGWSILSGAAITLIYLAVGRHFIAIMTQSAAVRHAAAQSLIWAAFVPLLAAGAFQLDGIFIGATWSRDMRNMMLIALAVFLAAWAVLTPAFGNAGLWAAFLIFLAGRGITLAVALRRRLRPGACAVAPSA